MGIEANTNYNGSYESFLASAFKSKGINISEEDIQDVFSYAKGDASEDTTVSKDKVKGDASEDTTVSKDKVKGAFEFKYGKGEDIENLLDTFLDVMDNLDSQQNDTLDIQYLDDNYDLEELFAIDSDMYKAIVDYESNGTVTNSNNNSSSNTSSSSTSTNASELKDLIPTNPVSYKNLGDASVNYHSEVPDSLRWTGNSTNVNVYSLKDGDSSEKFRKINPEDMRYFSGEYGKDIRVDGQKIIANETNEVIGYWNKNEDGTNSFYLKDGITYSSITSYLYLETAGNNDNSGSAGDSGSTGDGVKSETRTTFESSDEWKDSPKKQCSGTEDYFEKSGLTIDGDVVKKGDEIIGICEKKDDRVNITIINNDSTEKLTSEPNTVDGVEQGYYNYTENTDDTVTINIYGADSKTCTITSKVTEDGFEANSVEIGDEELTENNFKELIKSIKDPDTLDALFDYGILNKVQDLKKGEEETQYFKEILKILNTNGNYSDFADINSYKPNESEKTKYDKLKGSIKEKSSDSLEEILEACEKGEISVTSALYLLNKVAPDLCGDGDDTLEDLFRDMDSDSQEEHISTFLKLIVAANYRTQEDNPNVESSESAGSTEEATENTEKAVDDNPTDNNDNNSNNDNNKTADSGYTCSMTENDFKTLVDKFYNDRGTNTIYKDESKKEVIGTYVFDRGNYTVTFKGNEDMEQFTNVADIKGYMRATGADGVTTDVVHTGLKTYTIKTKEDGSIDSISVIGMPYEGCNDEEAMNEELIKDNEKISITIKEMIDALEDDNKELQEQLKDYYMVPYAVAGGTEEISACIYNKSNLSKKQDEYYKRCNSETEEAFLTGLLNNVNVAYEVDYTDNCFDVKNGDDEEQQAKLEIAREVLETLLAKYKTGALNDENGEISDLICWLDYYNNGDNLATIIDSFSSSEDKAKYLKFVCDILGEKEDE